MTITEKQIEVMESLDWRIHDGGEDIEIENYSPAGEDLVFTLYGETLLEAVTELYESYDAEEHAELWIDSRGKNGVPGSIRELLDDADSIEEMLRELAVAIMEVEKNV